MQVFFKVLNSTDFFTALFDQIRALAELFIEIVGKASNLFGTTGGSDE